MHSYCPAVYTSNSWEWFSNRTLGEEGKKKNNNATCKGIFDSTHASECWVEGSGVCMALYNMYVYSIVQCLAYLTLTTEYYKYTEYP